MPSVTKLSTTDKLPLTCSRSGTCCHGKLVGLNPWELARLAQAKNLSPRAFRDAYCDFGGIRLRFNGAPGWKNLPACGQYVPGFGCSVHSGRPLSCRLFPLGRQKQSGISQYIYQGQAFPCLEGCQEVTQLNHLSVDNYISGQAVKDFEIAQDEYLEFTQNLADNAFVLLLDSGLSDSGDRQTLRIWRKMGKEGPEQIVKRLDSEWIERLMLPELSTFLNDPVAYARQHNDLIQTQVQAAFSALGSLSEYRNASVLMMGLALYLGRGLGADPADLAIHWIKIAKQNGALD